MKTIRFRLTCASCIPATGEAGWNLSSDFKDSVLITVSPWLPVEKLILKKLHVHTYIHTDFYIQYVSFPLFMFHYNLAGYLLRD